MEQMKDFDPPLDEGIRPAVELLYRAGIETFASCEGGKGHTYKEPTIRFHGDRSEGFKALAIALQHGLPVSDIKRIWTIEDGEPTGPVWEIIFWRAIEKGDVMDALDSNPLCPACFAKVREGGPVKVAAAAR